MNKKIIAVATLITLAGVIGGAYLARYKKSVAPAESAKVTPTSVLAPSPLVEVPESPEPEVQRATKHSSIKKQSSTAFAAATSLVGPTYTVPAGLTMQVNYPFSISDTEVRCDNWPNKPSVLPCHIEIHAVATNDRQSSVPPTIDISYPGNGMTFGAGSNISFSVNTSDADNSVTRVDFYANDQFVGSTNPADQSNGSQAWALQKWVVLAYCASGVRPGNPPQCQCRNGVLGNSGKCR